MEKIFIFILCLLFLFTSLLAKEEYLAIYKGKEAIGQMTVAEFEDLVYGAEQYTKIIDAEQKGLVEMKVEADPVETKTPGQYKSKILVKWMDETSSTIHSITVEAIFNINNKEETKLPEWRIYYRSVAEYSTPVLILLCIIFAIL